MFSLFIYPLLFMQSMSLMASWVDQYFEGSKYVLSVTARSLVRSRSMGTITIALEGKNVSNNNNNITL